MKSSELTVLYEDNHLLVALKPAGVLIQGDKTGDPTLLAVAKQWLITKYQKPGNAFLGLVHRLDRPVAGVVVFAKTSKAASRLSTQFRQRTVQKSYLAVVQGHLNQSSATLTHYIKKRMGNRRVHIAERHFPDARQASLSYNVLETRDDLTAQSVRNNMTLVYGIQNGFFEAKKLRERGLDPNAAVQSKLEAQALLKAVTLTKEQEKAIENAIKYTLDAPAAKPAKAYKGDTYTDENVFEGL